MPIIPTFKKEHPYVHESQLAGFVGRLRNWESNLIKLENVSQKQTLEEKLMSKTEHLEIPEGVRLIKEV